MSRRTGGREARVKERSHSHVEAPAFIRRKVMPYDLLSPDGLDMIEAKADQLMAEVGIDITGEFPKPWTDDMVQAADVVVSMGCGDACPVFPGKRYETWELADPAGQGVDAVRPIRDAIEARVRRLLAELDISTFT